MPSLTVWLVPALVALGVIVACISLWKLFGAEAIKAAIVWPFKIFTEADGNGGKPSFSRILGAWVTVKIVMLVEAVAPADRATAVPEQLMTLFWVLIGYAIISKTIMSMGPGFQDIAKAILLRVLGGATPPAPKPTEPTA
jgi:hypothetical protein